MTASAADAPVTRPRVEGDREQEILAAALDVLAELGYDRLTMDAVAARSRASKATLYRRWSSKASLVIEALLTQKGPAAVPDTGTLRGDLLEAFCGMGGVTDRKQTAVMVSIFTAIGRDEEFATAFRRDFIGPKAEISQTIFERARARGEIRDDVDLDLLTPALPGIVLHRQFILGELPSTDLVTRVIDQIILPAVTHGAPEPAPTQNAHTQKGQS